DFLPGNPFSNRNAVPGDERHVWHPDLERKSPDRSCLPGEETKSVLPDEWANETYQVQRQERFLKSHELLHQEAVDQFVHPLGAFKEANQVVVRGSSRRDVGADPRRIDATELFEHVRKRLEAGAYSSSWHGKSSSTRTTCKAVCRGLRHVSSSFFRRGGTRAA